MKFTTLLAVYAALILLPLSSQAQTTSDQSSIYFEPELIYGKLIGNYSTFPQSSGRKNLVLSIGKQQHTTENSWARYYNFPATGVSMSVSNLGNSEAFGTEYAIMPFIVLNARKEHLKTWYLKLGLGSAYYPINFQTFPQNESVGSQFTWTFQAFVYKNLYIKDRLSVKAGAGFLHSSNGHIQLPNFGLNAGAVSISAQWFRKDFDPLYAKKNPVEIDRRRHYFLKVRQGIGLHEYGGTRFPLGGDKRPVITTSISGGVVYRNHIRVSTGLAYRYYNQYYEEITASENEFSDHPRRNSILFYWYLGGEFLLGHVGMNFEGGINVYKPYFDEHYEKYIHGSGLKEFLKKTFNSRMGLNLYVWNTNNAPKHNVFIGANIATNFGQADFSEVSLGYIHSLGSGN